MFIEKKINFNIKNLPLKNKDNKENITSYHNRE